MTNNTSWLTVSSVQIEAFSVHGETDPVVGRTTPASHTDMKPAQTAVLLGIVALMPTVLSLDKEALKSLEARQIPDRQNEVNGRVVRSVLDKKRSWKEMEDDDLVSARQNGEDMASPVARKRSSQHEVKQKKNNQEVTHLGGKQGKDAKGQHQGVEHKRGTFTEKKKTRQEIKKKEKNEEETKISRNKVQRKKVTGKSTTRNDNEDAKKGGRGETNTTTVRS